MNPTILTTIGALLLPSWGGGDPVGPDASLFPAPAASEPEATCYRETQHPDYPEKPAILKP